MVIVRDAQRRLAAISCSCVVEKTPKDEEHDAFCHSLRSVRKHARVPCSLVCVNRLDDERHALAGHVRWICIRHGCAVIELQ